MLRLDLNYFDKKNSRQNGVSCVAVGKTKLTTPFSFLLMSRLTFSLLDLLLCRGGFDVEKREKLNRAGTEDCHSCMLPISLCC